MKIEPKAFLAIEQSMATALHGEWTKLAEPLIASLHGALSRGDWPAAQLIANQMDFKGVVATVRPRLEELATAALIFGAHRASGDATKTVYAGGRLPDELHNAIDQLEHALESDAVEFIRAEVHAVIDDLRRADATAHMQKYDPDEARGYHGQWVAEQHPEPNDKGEPVTIHRPHEASAPDALSSHEAPFTVTPGSALPAALNGIPFKPWTDHPTRAEDWIHAPGQSSKFSIPFVKNPHKTVGSGVVLTEPDGRIWLTAPTNQYGGYRVTFPKGTVEHGLNLQGSAIKEAWEETGLKVKITGVVGDFERDTSKARFFTATRVGGSPAKMGWESQAMILATPEQAAKLVHRSVDKKILAAYLAGRKPQVQDQLFKNAQADAANTDRTREDAQVDRTDEPDETNAQVARDSKFYGWSKDDLDAAELADHGGLLQAEQGAPRKRKRQRITRTEGPKTLYVSRPLVNHEDLHAWMKAQGFKQAQKPGDLHVTQCYSKTPFDWDDLTPREDTVTVPGGPRSIQAFKDDGSVIVLELDSPQLQDEHDVFRDAGASYDFPTYRPHVSLTWEGAPRPVAQIEPYTGPLVFGPQKFKPINDDWKAEHEEMLLKADWDIVGALNKAVKTGGKVASDLGAQLTTSRLITLGFLSQSQKLGYTEYQVDEVLDEKTCEVCLYMNGKTFRVPNQINRVFNALNSQDPADAKVLTPWPSQSKAAMADLYAMSPEEMQAAGLGSPPYHPNCRGMLALAGSVEQTVPLGGPQDDDADLMDLSNAPQLQDLFGDATDQVEDADDDYPESDPVEDDREGDREDDTPEDDGPEADDGDDAPDTSATNIGKWTTQAIADLGWKRFTVTDPETFARVDAYFNAGKYDAADALINGWVSTNVVKEDDFEGPNAGKKKRKNQTPAAQPMDYSDIQPDSSSIAFDNSGLMNDNDVPIAR